MKDSSKLLLKNLSIYILSTIFFIFSKKVNISIYLNFSIEIIFMIFFIVITMDEYYAEHKIRA